MPVPVAMRTASRGGLRSTNIPSGGRISTVSPGCISNNRGESNPSCTRFRHNSKRFVSEGADAIEYARVIFFLVNYLIHRNKLPRNEREFLDFPEPRRRSAAPPARSPPIRLILLPCRSMIHLCPIEQRIDHRRVPVKRRSHFDAQARMRALDLSNQTRQVALQDAARASGNTESPRPTPRRAPITTPRRPANPDVPLRETRPPPLAIRRALATAPSPREPPRSPIRRSIRARNNIAGHTSNCSAAGSGK